MGNHQSQLLCTFCTQDDLENTIKTIAETYNIVFNTIYVLENIDVENTYCCTYNVARDSKINGKVPVATISMHRKKATSTLYTINALNQLIIELNNGKLDKEFSIPWENYTNTILVTVHGELKKISTKLYKVINLPS